MFSHRPGGCPSQQPASTRKLHVRTFGGLTVYHNDEPVLVRWGSRNARILFCHLAITCNQWMHRDQLCKLLWSGAAGDKPNRMNVVYYVNKVRRALTSVTEINPVISQGSAYRLNIEKISCDCDLFRTHAVQGIKLMARGEQPGAKQFLEHAHDLYEPPFLPEEPHDPFINTARQELAELFGKVRSCLGTI